MSKTVTTKTNFELARSIIRRYMADFTNSTTAPKSVKGGFYAMIASDTGEVWLGEATSFAATLTRHHGKNTRQLADCIRKARERGASIELWLLTQPARFSAAMLEGELIDALLIADRKSPTREGPGEMYVIRHRTTLNYFVVANRSDTSMDVNLTRFIHRLRTLGTKVDNKKLSDFVQQNANDILNCLNFDINLLGKFKDNDDLWLQRQIYIDGCQHGECLNHRDVEN